MSRQFKMYNKHVFCQLSITHLHFSLFRSHQRPKMEKFKIAVVEVNEIKNLKFTIKNLTKVIIKMLGLPLKLTVDCILH
jgi:hypothetical protein